MIYNLSLRMLGSLYDAQDATQEIIIKIITQLSTLLVMSAVLGTAISAAGHFIL